MTFESLGTGSASMEVYLLGMMNDWGRRGGGAEERGQVGPHAELGAMLRMILPCMGWQQQQQQW